MQTDMPGSQTQINNPPTQRAAVDPDGTGPAPRHDTDTPRHHEAQHLRLHVGTGQAPRLRQLAGMSGWAAVLTFGGLIVAIRAIVGIVAGEAPGWYQPTIVVVGLVGILLAVAAFVLAQMPKIVWITLSLSTFVLLFSVILTATAM